jgi:DNA-binding CsgD family transcriptional regulator
MSVRVTVIVKILVAKIREMMMNPVSPADWDIAGTGVILVNAAGRIMLQNITAKELLDRGDGLISRSGTISTTSRTTAAMLAERIHQATHPQNRHKSSAEQALRVARAATSPLMVLVTPRLTHFDDNAVAREPTAILLIKDPDRPPAILGRHLIDWFGLTPAEADLAVQLASGERLETLANSKGVRISTLRSQLRAVFGKTGADRQADLIGLLHRLPTTVASSIRPTAATGRDHGDHQRAFEQRRA